MASRRPPAVDPNKPRLLVTPTVLALVEPIVRPATASEAVVKGSMDRIVMRNVLSLAYMPRARACYLTRSGATAALRDLNGRVRLAIDVVRGEVERAAIESSTLNNADVEACLREGAFAVDVPRVMRNDAPVTAILNLVFRPQTPEKKREHELGAVGDRSISSSKKPTGARRNERREVRFQTPAVPGRKLHRRRRRRRALQGLRPRCGRGQERRRRGRSGRGTGIGIGGRRPKPLRR